jgi:hypothetical protein
MSLETTTDVDQLATVEDSDGNRQRPANEEQQRRQAEAMENATAGFADKFQPSTGGESCPSHSVADGKPAVVRADPDNAGIIYVGFGSATFPLAKGDALEFQITDTDLVTAMAGTDGDVLHLIGEGAN